MCLSRRPPAAVLLATLLCAPGPFVLLLQVPHGAPLQAAAARRGVGPEGPPLRSRSRVAAAAVSPGNAPQRVDTAATAPMLWQVECPDGRTLSDTDTLIVLAGAEDSRWWRRLPACTVALSGQSAGWNKCETSPMDFCMLHFLANNFEALPAWLIFTRRPTLDWMDSVPKDMLLLSLPAAPTRSQYLPLPTAFVRPTSLSPETYFQKKAFLDATSAAWTAVTGGRGVLDVNQTLYCCSQFVVARDAVHRHPPHFYRALQGAVALRVDPSVAYPLEMLWHPVFVEGGKIPGATHVQVRQWREEAILWGCQEWGCTCKGFLDKQKHEGPAFGDPADESRRQAWWDHGGYGAKGYFQMDVDSQYLVEFYSVWSPTGRTKGGYGSCAGEIVGSPSNEGTTLSPREALPWALAKGDEAMKRIVQSIRHLN